MAIWFVAEVGRGSGLVAYVYGPYNTKSEYLAANRNSYGTFQTVGNQAGYNSRAEAQHEADYLNTGSASTPTQNEPTGPPANLNTSPNQIGKRVQAAGGTTGELPHIPQPAPVNQTVPFRTGQRQHVDSRRRIRDWCGATPRWSRSPYRNR